MGRTGASGTACHVGVNKSLNKLVRTMQKSNSVAMEKSAPPISLSAVTRGRAIGAILVEAGRLAPASAEQILQAQAQGLRFGEAALSLGLLKQQDIDFALSRQFDFPYLQDEGQIISDELVAAYQPFSAVAEQLRALRTQLMMRWFDGGPAQRVLPLLSLDRGDGRSFIAANLAVVFAQLGQRTLLIDADLRRPRQHRLFKLDARAAGLSDLLSGRAGTETVVRIPEFLRLSLLPAGAIPPNPQELLSRPRFQALLGEVRDEYDVVLIDTPPAQHSADAQVVASRAAGALLIARCDHTSSATLRLLSNSLASSGVVVVGAALNVR